MSLKRRLPGELPGSLVVGTQCSHCCDRGSLPGGGTKMLKATHKVRPREEKRAFFFQLSAETHVPEFVLRFHG